MGAIVMPNEFKLDTSGFVDVWSLGNFRLPARPYFQTTVVWTDLDPFTQGYIEALFEAAHDFLMDEWADSRDGFAFRYAYDKAKPPKDRSAGEGRKGSAVFAAPCRTYEEGRDGQ